MSYDNAQRNSIVRIVHLEGYGHEASLLRDSLEDSDRWRRDHKYFSKGINGVPIKQDIVDTLGSDEVESGHVDILIVGIRDQGHIDRLVEYAGRDRPEDQYVVALTSNQIHMGTAKGVGACHKEILKTGDFDVAADEIAKGYDAWLRLLAMSKTSPNEN